MGLRFFRRVRIAPGIWINLTKTGASLSLGVRGAHVTVGRHGVRRTIGIPGTGLYYTTTSSGRSRARSRKHTTTKRSKDRRAPAPPKPRDPLELSFFDRLLMPGSREHFIDGLRALVRGDRDAALKHLARADRNPDAAFLAGLLLLERGRTADAEASLKLAASRPAKLGRELDRLGVRACVQLAITDELHVELEPSLRGALLALVEVYQRQGRDHEAIAALRRLLKQHPDDLLARVSLAELLYHRRCDPATCRRILEIVPAVQNRSLLHAAAMLYRARALRRLGLRTAARDVLTAALRRRSDRPQTLLLALRYERGCVYEELGRRAQARREFERIFAQDPDYADVRERLFAAGHSRRG